MSLSTSSPSESSRLSQLVCAGKACRRMVWRPSSHWSRRWNAAFWQSPQTVMRGAFRWDGLLKSRATSAFVQLTTFLWCSLLSIILTVWFLPALFVPSFVTRFT